MNLPTIISHHGKQIYYIDFSYVKTTEEVRVIINQAKMHILLQEHKSLLVLSSLEMMHINNEIKNLFVEFLNENRDYVNASAVIGLNSLSQIVFKNTIRQTRRDIKSFASIEQAKNWLAAKLSIETARVIAN